jgi:hypothetical protein
MKYELLKGSNVRNSGYVKMDYFMNYILISNYICRYITASR